MEGLEVEAVEGILDALKWKNEHERRRQSTRRSAPLCHKNVYVHDPWHSVNDKKCARSGESKSKYPRVQGRSRQSQQDPI